MEIKDVSKSIKIGTENMLEENKLNLFVVNDEILTSTDLGKPFEKSGRAVNLLLHKAGFLEKNENKEEKSKWKLSEKGKKFAVTPVKQLVTIIDEYNVLVRQKKENPQWIGKMRLEFEKIILEEKGNGTK